MYSNQYDDRIIIAAQIEMPNELALINGFIIGVVIDGGIYPLWTRMRNQIIVRISNGRNLLMTPELHLQYDHYFTPFIRRPSGDHFHGLLPRN